MKKELFYTMTEKITMSDECVGAILDAIDEVPHETPKKKISHIKLIPLLTAAVIFIFGSVTVAAEMGGFDWVKAFFGEDMIFTEDIMEMSGEMENFKCESEVGAKLSPVGVFATSQDLYCMFRVDDIDKKYSNTSFFFNGMRINDTLPGMWGVSTPSSYTREIESNIVILPLIVEADTLHENDKISIELQSWTEEEFENYSQENDNKPTTIVEFNLKLGKTKELYIDFNEYMYDGVPKRNYDFLFENLTITPVSLSTFGHSQFYADEMLIDGFTIVCADGTKIETGRNGFSTSSSAYFNDSPNSKLADRVPAKQDITFNHSFEKPINPENVTEIYLGEMKIYEK